MVYMGNRLILIQSTTEKKTEKMIKVFDEWSEFWLDWWKLWEAMGIHRCKSKSNCMDKMGWGSVIGMVGAILLLWLLKSRDLARNA